MDGMTGPEPTPSSACCAGLVPTVRSGNSGLLGEFRIESLTCPSKPNTARLTQLTSTGSGYSHQPGHPNQELSVSLIISVSKYVSQISFAPCAGRRADVNNLDGTVLDINGSAHRYLRCTGRKPTKIVALGQDFRGAWALRREEKV